MMAEAGIASQRFSNELVGFPVRTSQQRVLGLFVNAEGSQAVAPFVYARRGREI